MVPVPLNLFNFAFAKCVINTNQLLHMAAAGVFGLSHREQSSSDPITKCGEVIPPSLTFLSYNKRSFGRSWKTCITENDACISEFSCTYINIIEFHFP